MLIATFILAITIPAWLPAMHGRGRSVVYWIALIAITFNSSVLWFFNFCLDTNLVFWILQNDLLP